MSGSGVIEAYQAKDYKSELKPIWCPACGDYGVVQAIYRALAAVGRPPHEIALIWRTEPSEMQNQRQHSRRLACCLRKDLTGCKR